MGDVGTRPCRPAMPCCAFGLDPTLSVGALHEEPLCHLERSRNSACVVQAPSSMLRRRLRPAFQLGPAGVEEPAEGRQLMGVLGVALGLDAKAHETVEDPRAIVGNLL